MPPAQPTRLSIYILINMLFRAHYCISISSLCLHSAWGGLYPYLNETKHQRGRWEQPDARAPILQGLNHSCCPCSGLSSSAGRTGSNSYDLKLLSILSLTKTIFVF